MFILEWLITHALVVATLILEWFESHAVVVTQMITLGGILYNIFKTHDLHVTFNSKMDAALKTQREAGVAEGIQMEREAQMERDERDQEARDKIAKKMLIAGIMTATAWVASMSLS